MKKVLLVHGYNGAPKVFDYFKTELEKRGFQVIAPEFPTTTDITEAGYFRVFDEYKDIFDEDLIVIAHSVGNIMLVKYLVMRRLKIGTYISLAGFGEPFVVPGREELNAIVHPLKLSDTEKALVPELISRRFAIYSDDDHIVPFDILKKYVSDISAKDCFIPGIGHMGHKSGLLKLPEVLEIVK